jgi:hypothetical protein
VAPAGRKRGKPAGKSRWKSAFHDYRLLLLAGLVYVFIVTLEAVVCGISLGQYATVCLAILVVLIKCIMLLVAFGVWAFLRAFFRRGAGKGLTARLRRANAEFSRLSSAYLDGEVFAYGMVGMVTLFAIDFFFIQKSLLRHVSPYAWDPLFATVDKALHFGHYPHEAVIAFSDALSLGRAFDIAYYLWFVMMYLVLGYNLFLDTDLKRRLRVMWVFLLSWVLLGSLAATIFASTGPLFYAEFYPDAGDPYASLLAHFDAKGPGTFPIAWRTRDLLIGWTRSDKLINLNALSAMPSLHMAIAWLAVLYARSISRAWFAIAAVFAALIFLGTIYFGFHYAIDSYVSIAAVTLMWLITGKLLDLRHRRPQRLALEG